MLAASEIKGFNKILFQKTPGAGRNTAAACGKAVLVDLVIKLYYSVQPNMKTAQSFLM